MRQRSLGRRGQNTVEYLLMVSVVVGVVLIGGAALKRFMPSLFGGVQDMIAGAATEEAGADGGTASSSSGPGKSGYSGAQPHPSDDGAEVASTGADGGTASHDDGHPHAHKPPVQH